MIAQAWGHNPGRRCWARRSCTCSSRTRPSRWAGSRTPSSTSPVWDMQARRDRMHGRARNTVGVSTPASPRTAPTISSAIRAACRAGGDCKYAEGFQSVFPAPSTSGGCPDDGAVLRHRIWPMSRSIPTASKESLRFLYPRLWADAVGAGCAKRLSAGLGRLRVPQPQADAPPTPPASGMSPIARQSERRPGRRVALIEASGYQAPMAGRGRCRPWPGLPLRGSLRPCVRDLLRHPSLLTAGTGHRPPRAEEHGQRAITAKVPAPRRIDHLNLLAPM
jgi:hypothetical protein